MTDSDAATHQQNDWPAQGMRQRLGGRLERRVLRSAVDMLDERGTDLDSIEQKLVEREQNLAERLAAAEAEEAQLSHRERRLAEVGATHLEATRRIDHLIRELDQTESTAAAYLARADAKVNDAEQKARDLADRVRRLEEAEHKRVLSAADITRRESALRSREHELRQPDERLREREQALGATQHTLIAKEQQLEERQRRLEHRERALGGRGALRGFGRARARAGRRGDRRRPSDLAASRHSGGGRAAGIRRCARLHARLACEQRIPRRLAGLPVARRGNLRGARRETRVVLRLRQNRRARDPGRRDDPPRRLVLASRGSRSVARPGDGRRSHAHAGHRPLLLQVDLLSRAKRRAVRDRDNRAGVHVGRAVGVARRAVVSPAQLRAVPRTGRADADAAARSTCEDAGVVSLKHLVRPAAGDPEGALVLFHGRGTSEHDLYPLLDALDPQRRLLGATPRGPLALHPGGAHWYIVREIGFPDRESFMSSYELAAAWLDGLAEETGIPAARTIVGGFSQGAVMSWALGLGRGRPRPAGVVARPGVIPTGGGFGPEPSSPGPPR